MRLYPEKKAQTLEENDMKNVTELAQTKELAFLMTERFTMNPISCKHLNEAWHETFPDEVAVAKRLLALVEALEARDKQIAELRVSNRILCSDAMAKQERIAELEARTFKVEMPEAFYPDGDTEVPYVLQEDEVIAAIVAAGGTPIAICRLCKSELNLSHRPDGSHYCHSSSAGVAVEGE